MPLFIFGNVVMDAQRPVCHPLRVGIHAKQITAEKVPSVSQLIVYSCVRSVSLSCAIKIAREKVENLSVFSQDEMRIRSGFCVSSNGIAYQGAFS
jgi:hypothetical protein